jgi:hypothetical protein
VEFIKSRERGSQIDGPLRLNSKVDGTISYSNTIEKISSTN